MSETCAHPSVGWDDILQGHTCHYCRSFRAHGSETWQPPKPSVHTGLGSEPKTEIVPPGVEQIPFEGMEAIGEIFSEGAEKYGVDNWKQGIKSKRYQLERCRHAIRHLMLWSNGDRSENHLAKVAWFCVTQLWLQRSAEAGKETPPINPLHS